MPALPDLDLMDPGLHASGRAHAAYAALRRDEPVSWRGGYWAVTRHADVIAVATDPVRFSSARGTGTTIVDARPPLRSVHISDPPIHTEMRALLEAALGAGWLRALAGWIDAETSRLIASWSGTVDAVAMLADPLAFGVLQRMLDSELAGLMPALQRFARYDDARYRRPGETADDCYRDGERAVWVVLDELLAERRRCPGDDLASRMLALTALADADRRYLLRLVAQTTYQTTALAIAAAVAAIAERPGLLQTVSCDHTPRAGDEILRWSSPVIRFARHVTRDTELAGARLRAGDRVVMFFASANRDDRVFADPDDLDLARAPNHHVAFGAGPHACAGAALARLQLVAVIDALRDRPIALVEPPRAFRSSVIAGFDRVVISA